VDIAASRMARWRCVAASPTSASCTTSVLTATGIPRHMPGRQEGGQAGGQERRPRVWFGAGQDIGGTVRTGRTGGRGAHAHPPGTGALTTHVAGWNGSGAPLKRSSNHPAIPLQLNRTAISSAIISRRAAGTTWGRRYPIQRHGAVEGPQYKSWEVEMQGRASVLPYSPRYTTPVEPRPSTLISSTLSLSARFVVSSDCVILWIAAWRRPSVLTGRWKASCNLIRSGSGVEWGGESEKTVSLLGWVRR
jgi:hypothetical protein